MRRPIRSIPRHSATLCQHREGQRTGAETIRLKSRDPVQAILDFAASHNVGHIIVGRSMQPWWKQLLGRSIPLRLVRQGRARYSHRLGRDEVNG